MSHEQEKQKQRSCLIKLASMGCTRHCSQCCRKELEEDADPQAVFWRRKHEGRYPCISRYKWPEFLSLCVSMRVMPQDPREAKLYINSLHADWVADNREYEKLLWSQNG